MYEESGFPASAAVGPESGIPASASVGLETCRAVRTGHARERQDMMRQELQEKREMLESSLMRYTQVRSQLHHSPENQLLRQSHEEAEIEAAGYEAEVAVLSQKLHDLDDALRLGGEGGALA